MNDGNVISFTRNGSSARSSRRGDGYSQEPDVMLGNLRSTKRLAKSDQAVLVENLGRLIVELGADNARTIARSVLEENEREKRKRYIRLPGERVGRLARHAASGGSFARIIERLINIRVNENVSREQAKSEVVRKALWRTSFRPAPHFLMPTNRDKGDNVQFAADMKAICDRLADETELANFLALVARHPVFPDDAWYQWTHALELTAGHDPNRIYDWGWDTDDYELDEWIPWWAPRCLIGHWYIPFTCRHVQVPDECVAEILARQEGKPCKYTSDYYEDIEPFINEECTTEARLFHRLPIWLVILPLPDRLVPCLYAALHHPGGFYPHQKYPLTDGSLHPSFVGSIGTVIGDDAAFLPEAEDDYDTFYALASQTEIRATGSRVDDSIANFKCDLMFGSVPNELPEWLEEQPVQRFLRLTADSDAAMSFALTSRKFAGRERRAGDGTVFRPAFPDENTPYTGLPHDTIAAYLLKKFCKRRGIHHLHILEKGRGKQARRHSGGLAREHLEFS
jgi:hypothetical protein